ncbi:MAG: AAA family ATPase [Phormidesmis sp.]
MVSLSTSTREGFPDISGYAVTEQLYEGARTAVYRAVSEDQQPVVIKVMRQTHPDFSELVHFRNQYVITKNLPIPGIARPLSLEPWQNGYALVMEDFHGLSLEEYTADQLLSITEVLGVALQMADVLHGLNQHYVVHKDIKPANILIHPESKQIQLIDFSIATLLLRETQEIQNPNVLEGTLAYLAPEQTGRMNRGIDYRTDFYGLGVTLYKLLTGQVPFLGTDPLELVHCHIAKPPVPVQEVNAAIPVMISQIVLKLMAKNAEDRYQSASGLKRDLVRCLQVFKETGEIAEFEVGQRDISAHFLIPNKLYGRETEVQTLLKAFERIADGASELMLVAGFSGIGKTAVVNEVHKPITRQQGYFIKGKFDQFNRNIPLSAFVQALRDLMGQLLSESDVQLMQWKTQILAAVGENGQLLIDVIPELKTIIGQQPPVSELSGSAAQNRFNLLFQKFIEVFTTAAHPLVLFLDDLQWADLASLQLIKLLMNDNGYLLILGAYRDNEVSPTHPFMMTVEELKTTGSVLNTIILKPLTLTDTNALIADTLHCSTQLAKPLTELVDRKTKGNPFFSTQFLKALHEENHIIFNRDHRYWECDLAQINMMALTDDVMEFMARQLQKLPTETQAVLKLAACVGNQFNLATLAIVSEQLPTDAAAALWKALQEGFILPTSQVYKFFSSELETADSDRTSELATSFGAPSAAYRFLHDRVQQAAYALIDKDERQPTHLLIGRLLLQNSSGEKIEDSIFEIVNHLNSASELITDLTEREELAGLNLKAGEKAKSSTAYESASKYLNTGIGFLAEDSWQTQYDLTLTLYTTSAENALLCGDYEMMEALAETVLNHANNILDTIKIHKVKIQASTAQNQQQACLDTGLSVLKQLGITLDVDLPNRVESIQELIHSPKMNDPYKLAAADLLVDVITPAWTLNPEIFQQTIFTLVNLSLNFGHCPSTAFGYAWYGTLLCETHGDIDSGYQFGQLALKLLDKFEAEELRASVTVLFATHISHWKDHVRTSFPFHLEGLRLGLETGNLEYAGYGAVEYCQYLFLAGESLDIVEKKCSHYEALVHKLQLQFHLLYLAPWQQGVLNLRKHLTAQTTLLIGDCYDDEQEHLQRILDEKQLTLGFINFSVKAFLSLLFADYEKAVEYSHIALQNRNGVFGTYFISTTVFYASLALLGNYPNVSASQQQQYSQQILENLSILEKRAVDAPTNYQHKYDLVKAEYCRVLDQKANAIDLYDLAISEAKDNDYLQEEALANELAAKFYLYWGKEKVAAGYMQEAYYSYTRWGALAKIDDLEQRYPTLLQPIFQQARQSRQAFNPLETIAIIANPNFSIHASSSQATSASTTNINVTLDFATVLRASQALSGTIELEDLLRQLTQIILQNSGGDRCALILADTDGTWKLQALATPDNTDLCSEPFVGHPKLPLKLIQYVKNTRETVVIDNLETDLPVIDAYLEESQPQSLLCLPLLNQGKLLGILYLRNRNTRGAFTQERIHILEFLCTQAAISLKNARLYQQAQTYAEQLKQSQLKTVQAEKMASLGNLVAGIAHEINNPIGFLNGSIENAKTYLQELFEYLALYQQHYPPTAEPVQEKAEDIDLDFLLKDFPKLLDSMTTANQRIKSISTSLRTFSRADTEHKVSADLHEGLDSTLMILKYRLKANEHRPAIAVVTDYGELPIIDCFPGQLNQVFMNLLANAIDIFDEAAEKLSFAELEEQPQIITVKTILCPDQKGLEVRIGDNGKGMSEEVKARIFDHLFTTKGVGKGTGLGLAISQQIVVEKHGGGLTVQSELGQGTEFCIQLPF